jgi:membrane protein
VKGDRPTATHPFSLSGAAGMDKPKGPDAVMRRKYWQLARKSVDEFFEDSPFQLAAALSFYTVLSLSPLVLIVVAAAGLVWGEQPVRSELLNQIRELTGDAGAETVRTVLESTTISGQSIGSMILGIITLLFGATTVFAQLQSSLNQIWDVKTAVKTVTRRGLLWSLIRTRLLSLTLVLAVGFLLLVSLVVSAALAAFQAYLSRAFPGGGTLWQILNFLVSLLVISVLIAMVYRVLPDVRLDWPDVWVGAVTTSLLFGVGKFLIGLYLGRASIGSSYGAAGSLVVFLVWVYYSSLIMFFGAEITFVYAQDRRNRVRPTELAVVADR